MCFLKTKNEQLFNETLNKPSTEIHYIKYTDWITVNGVLLPKTLQWYDTKNNLPNTPKNSANFENIKISKEEAYKFAEELNKFLSS